MKYPRLPFIPGDNRCPKSTEQPSKRLLQLIALSSIGAGVLGAIIGVIVFQFMSDMNAAQPAPKPQPRQA